MIDHALNAGLEFPVFTLDTNLLFPETYDLKTRLEKFWGITIEALAPELTLDAQATEYGAELWKKAPDVCCSLRKVVPLQKKLSTLAVWITGAWLMSRSRRLIVKVDVSTPSEAATVIWSFAV